MNDQERSVGENPDLDQFALAAGDDSNGEGECGVSLTESGNNDFEDLLADDAFGFEEFEEAGDDEFGLLGEEELEGFPGEPESGVDSLEAYGELDGYEGFEEESDELEDFAAQAAEPEADEFFGSFLPPGFGQLTGTLKNLTRLAGKLYGVAEAEELEMEGESDSEDELGDLEVPGLSLEDYALAEDLAAQAAAAECDGEAQSLVGGITIHIIAPAPFKIKKVAPIIIRRTTRLVRLLRNKKTPGRVLVRTVPTIIRRTVGSLVRKGRKGKPVTKRTAVRVLAKQTRRVLSSPKRTAAALVRNRVKRARLRRPLPRRRQPGRLSRRRQQRAVRRAERFV